MAITPISGDIESQEINDNFSSLQSDLMSHLADEANPHGVNAQQISELDQNSRSSSDGVASYPRGVTTMRVTTNLGFPSSFGAILTSRSIDYGLQIFVDIVSGKRFYMRSSYDWNWYELLHYGSMFFKGAGSPEGVVTANVGAVYQRTDGGASTTFYIKEAGNGTNTGWVAK